MEFKLNKIIKMFIYMMITLVTLNMINAIEIVPGFQYGGDMISYQDKLYVSDSGNNAILSFNKTNGVFLSLIAVGSKPSDLFIEGNNLYVSVTGSSKIIKYDLITNNIIDTYDLDFKPGYFSKKGNYLYILESGTQWVDYPRIYDVNTKKIIGKLPQIPQKFQIYSPKFLQINGDNLYFSNTGSSPGNVYIYNISNPMGSFVKESPFNKFSNIWDFKVDPKSGLLYVVSARELTVTDNNFVVKNSLNNVDYSVGIGNNLLFTYNFDNNIYLYSLPNLLKELSIDLSLYNLNFIKPHGIYLDSSDQLFVLGTNGESKNSLISIIPGSNNAVYINDFLNDNHIDLKVLDVNISKQQNNANIEYFNLNFKIKNVGSTPINLNNLNINGTFISSPYHPINVINSNGNFLQPNSSINVETYLDILPQTTIMAQVKFEVYPKNPFFDINLNDNKAEITYNFTKTPIINSFTQNGQNGRSTTQPNVIIDNSVNTVIVDKSVTNIGAVNVDNSVNTLNIQNSTINVATNVNSMVNSKANLNKNQNFQKNNPNGNNDLKNENSGKNIKNENNNIKIEDVNNSNKLKNSCKKDGINYDIGVRLYSAQNPTYCDVDNLFKSQKDIGSVCQNNFECGTNTCSSGVCTDINAKLDKQTNLLQEILDWLKSFFGGRK